MNRQNRILIDWLNDAYEMEETILHILEGYAIDAEDYLDLARIVEDQLRQARSQSDRIKREIERLGGTPRGVESRELIDLTSPLQYTAANIERDRVVKNALTQHAFEHFSDAAYLALARTADLIGEHETARVCREIMLENQIMARDIDEIIPWLIGEFLRKQGE